MIIKTVSQQASYQISHTHKLSQQAAKFEAQLLLQHVLKVNRAWLIAHESDVLPSNNYILFEALVNRRLIGEPIAYILGYREFYGLTLKVTADTLIPRPDTETLVDAALAKIPQSNTSSLPSFPHKRESILNLEPNLNVEPSLKTKIDSHLRGNDVLTRVENDNNQISILDLGTGTGAIALAIAVHRPNARLTAVDASQATLNIAIENAQNLNINNISFVLSNWFSALNKQMFDVIVSNPPYIKQADAHLKQGDLRFEPLAALASGLDGLDDIRLIINSASLHLNANGWLMLEHGYDQANSVAALLAKAGFSEISHVQDLAGISRVTIASYVAA